MFERFQDAATAAQSAARTAELAAQAAGQAARDAARAAGGQGGNTPAPPSPPPLPGIERMTYNQLRRVQSELQDQRQVIANRRGALADQYENATGVNKDGMSARLQIMDNNIVQLEAQIATVGNQMASKAGTSQSQQPGVPPGSWSEDDVAGLGFGVFFSTVLVTVMIMRRLGRRRRNFGHEAQQPTSIQSNERLERIEQAVDTIAVEIERVSENQRFMTRLMTETQLGATINDVRKSTELARSAADQPGA